MIVERLEILVEELSMEVFVRNLIPKLLPSLPFEVYRYQGKPDLIKRLPARLQGYSSWLPPTWRIVVLVDRDSNDCLKLKADLEKIAADAGLTTRTKSGTHSYQVVTRIAIEELEAWYFGDWEAVRKAYPRVPVGIPGKKQYKNPDDIRGGTWETFERILKNAGYFKGGLRKIEAARAVSAHIEPRRNTSQSFQMLMNVVHEMTQ